MRTIHPKRIGLAIVGAGRVGLMRGEIAARFPQVDWIGIAEIDPGRASHVAAKLGADFVTTDYRELLRRPEVTAALISTVGHLHADPTLAALENPNKVSLLIEKPLTGDRAGADVKAVGVAPQRSQLFINGKLVKPDDSGRFSVPVGPVEVVVFKVVSGDTESHWVRRLRR